MEIESVFTYVYDCDPLDEVPELLIVRLDKIDEVEKNFLNNNNIIWRKFEGKIEIFFFSPINYLVEYETSYKEGMYFEKTEEYYNYYEETCPLQEMDDEVKNLIICKDKLKLEIFISIGEGDIKWGRNMYKRIFKNKRKLT